MFICDPLGTVDNRRKGPLSKGILARAPGKFETAVQLPGGRFVHRRYPRDRRDHADAPPDPTRAEIERDLVARRPPPTIRSDHHGRRRALAVPGLGAEAGRLHGRHPVLPRRVRDCAALLPARLLIAHWHGRRDITGWRATRRTAKPRRPTARLDQTPFDVRIVSMNQYLVAMDASRPPPGHGHPGPATDV